MSDVRDMLLQKYGVEVGKLDHNGYSESLITKNMDECFNCHRPYENWHELQYGTSDRKKSKALGLWIPLCRECHAMAHRKKDVIDDYHKLAQQTCDNYYGKGTFFKVFGRNYL